MEVIIIAHIPGKGSLNKTDFKSGHGLLINETETRNMTSKQLQDKVIEAQDKTTGLRPPTLKTGIFQTTLVSWDPIFKYNYTGETWINAGKLLRINLTCDGSGKLFSFLCLFYLIDNVIVFDWSSLSEIVLTCPSRCRIILIGLNLSKDSLGVPQILYEKRNTLQTQTMAFIQLKGCET